MVWDDYYNIPCTYCHEIERGDELPDEQYDRYSIYAGRWHPSCWAKHGYGNYVFDPTYAGERLEEDY